MLRHTDEDDALDLNRLVYRTMDQIPKQGISLFAEVVAVCTDASSDVDIVRRARGDALLLMLPRLMLTPLGGPSWNTRSQRAFKKRCHFFLEGKWRLLWTEGGAFAVAPIGDTAFETHQEAVSAARRRTGEDDERSEVERLRDYAVSSIRNGRVAQGLQRLTSLGTAGTSAPVAARLGQMQHKRTPSNSQKLSPEKERLISEYVGDLELDEEDVGKAVHKAKFGAAAGPSGWRMEHFKAIAKADGGVSVLTIIFNRIAQGKFGSEQVSMGLLTAARLIALNRKDVKIRPVAIGEALRRIVGGAVMRKVRAGAEAVCLQACNFAFTRGGASHVKLAIDLLVAGAERSVVIETDLKEAFQRASRDVMRGLLYDREELRPLLPFFDMFYEHEKGTALFFGSIHELTSEEGAQQGCSLGTLLFVLSTCRVIDTVKARYPDVEILGFADDYRFVGEVRQTCNAVRLYRRLVEQEGHVFQNEKSKIFSRSTDTLLDPAVAALCAQGPDGEKGMEVAPDGLIILGAPMGSSDFLRENLDKKGLLVENELEKLEKLAASNTDGGKQAALLMLKYCTYPKVTHLLRSIPPSVIDDAAKRHDGSIARALSKMIAPSDPLERGAQLKGPDGTVFDDWRRERAEQQAQLAVQAGGLGLYSLRLLSPIAYVSAWADFLRFMRTAPAGLLLRVQRLLTEVMLKRAARSRDSPIFHLKRAYDAIKGRVALQASDEDDLGSDGAIEMTLALGDEVTDYFMLSHALRNPQHRLSQFALDSAARRWKLGVRDANLRLRDSTRLTACGGKESGWVAQCPTRPGWRLTNDEWTDAMCHRLHIPLPFLVGGPDDCDCHYAYDLKTTAVVDDWARVAREDRRPKPVDFHGQHEHSCPHSLRLARHNRKQRGWVQIGKAAKKPFEKATVHELRSNTFDRSMVQADLKSAAHHGLDPEGRRDTIVDVAICNTLCATYLNTTNGERGFGADKRAAAKNSHYNKIIKDKHLDLHHLPATAETYGAFGKSTWHLLKTIIDDDHPNHYDNHNSWSKPNPMRSAVLDLGFAIQQGLSQQLRAADKRRRNRRNLGWHAGLRRRKFSQSGH